MTEAHAHSVSSITNICYCPVKNQPVNWNSVNESLPIHLGTSKTKAYMINSTRTVFIYCNFTLISEALGTFRQLSFCFRCIKTFSWVFKFLFFMIFQFHNFLKNYNVQCYELWSMPWVMFDALLNAMLNTMGLCSMPYAMPCSMPWVYAWCHIQCHAQCHGFMLDAILNAMGLCFEDCIKIVAGHLLCFNLCLQVSSTLASSMKEIFLVSCATTHHLDQLALCYSYPIYNSFTHSHSDKIHS